MAWRFSENANDNRPQKKKYEANCHDVQLADHGCPPVLETHEASSPPRMPSNFRKLRPVDFVQESPPEKFAPAAQRNRSNSHEPLCGLWIS